MCTVLYLPVENGFQFFTLRDENPLLAQAEPPTTWVGPSHSFLAPLVADNRGTWMGVTEQGDALFLLNGARQAHVKGPQHTISRGLVVMDLLRSKWPVMEWIMKDLTQTEPFTLIAFTEGNLFELVWDGAVKHKSILPKDQPAIWSSSTLYDQGAQLLRKQCFEQWLTQETERTEDAVLAFFDSVKDRKNGFFMDRGEALKTMSFAAVKGRTGQGAVLHFLHFETQSTHTASISFAPPLAAPACLLSIV